MDDRQPNHSRDGARPSARSIPIHRTCPSIDHEQAREGKLYEEYFKPALPVAVRGGMRDWRAVEKWQDTEYLISVLGDTVVQILSTEESEGGVRREMQRIRLSDFWRIVSEDTGNRYYYLPEKPIVVEGEPVLLGGVAEDIQVPPYLRDLKLLKAVMFAGRNTRCACHYHSGSEAMLCQVRGTKRVLLFDPSHRQLRALHAQPWLSFSFNFSRVRFPRDGSMPDLRQFPRFARARAVECVLEPGDMLFIPVFWWHIAWGTGFNISVTHFWTSPWRSRYLHLRAFRGHVSPKTVRSRWRRLTGRSQREVRRDTVVSPTS